MSVLIFYKYIPELYRALVSEIFKRIDGMRIKIQITSHIVVIFFILIHIAGRAVIKTEQLNLLKIIFEILTLELHINQCVAVFYEIIFIKFKFKLTSPINIVHYMSVIYIFNLSDIV